MFFLYGQEAVDVKYHPNRIKGDRLTMMTTLPLGTENENPYPYRSILDHLLGSLVTGTKVLFWGQGTQVVPKGAKAQYRHLLHPGNLVVRRNLEKQS